MNSWRLKVMLFLFSVLAAIIIGRLFYIQVINRKYYQSQALGQQAGFKKVQGDRGEIFFKNSKESHGKYGSLEVKSLAINKEKWSVVAVPKNIKDKDNFAKVVSGYIGLSRESILSKITEGDSYVMLRKDLPLGQIQDLKKAKLEGLGFEDSTARYYPQEALASHVIGFLGGGNIGQYGIEGHYEDILKGKEGIQEKKTGFNIIDSQHAQGSLNGSDLFLTIDYNIQFQAEALLQEAKNNIDIDSGQIIVMKPDSGRILALANFPFFNPNKYSKENDFGIFQNAVVQKIFEPGSVFKPLIMAMALNEGKVLPDSTFVDEGFVKVGPDIVYNFDRKKYGLQTMSGILEKSINTGAMYLASLLPHDTFLNYLERLGFNQKTGIDLQGEVFSRNDILKKGSDFGFTTASFGQGIEMTPMQLIRAFSVLANGGRIVKPYIVEKIVHNQDEIIIKPEISKQVVTPSAVLETTKMMVNVVDRGFGKSAKINGYYLAGKTGTAEVPITNGKGYYSDKTIQSFIGFGPALKPEFLILVKLDNPKVPKSSLSAAPIFKKMAQYILNYWQIPPDY